MFNKQLQNQMTKKTQNNTNNYNKLFTNFSPHLKKEESDRLMERLINLQSPCYKRENSIDSVSDLQRRSSLNSNINFREYQFGVSLQNHSNLSKKNLNGNISESPGLLEQIFSQDKLENDRVVLKSEHSIYSQQGGDYNQSPKSGLRIYNQQRENYQYQNRLYNPNFFKMIQKSSIQFAQGNPSLTLPEISHISQEFTFQYHNQELDNEVQNRLRVGITQPLEQEQTSIKEVYLKNIIRKMNTIIYQTMIYKFGKKDFQKTYPQAWEKLKKKSASKQSMMELIELLSQHRRFLWKKLTRKCVLDSFNHPEKAQQVLNQTFREIFLKESIKDTSN